MKCGLNSSLSYVKFGAKTESDPMKNGTLNFGVVVPPDKLPNASLYNAVQSKEIANPKKEADLGSTNKLTAGKFSAGCAFLAMALTAVSLLPFIRKH